MHACICLCVRVLYVFIMFVYVKCVCVCVHACAWYTFFCARAHAHICACKHVVRVLRLRPGIVCCAGGSSKGHGSPPWVPVGLVSVLFLGATCSAHMRNMRSHTVWPELRNMCSHTLSCATCAHTPCGLSSAFLVRVGHR